MNNLIEETILNIKNFLFNYDKEKFYGKYIYEDKEYIASNLLFSLIIQKYRGGDFVYFENIDLNTFTDCIYKTLIPKYSDKETKEKTVKLLTEILDITDQIVRLNSITFSFHDVLTNRIKVDDLKQDLIETLNDDMRFSLPHMDKVEKEMMKRFEDIRSPLIKLVKSKARGNQKQMAQQFLSIGYKVDKQSNILKRPIIESLIEGVRDENSYFVQAIGCRNAIIQGTNSVADSGYLNRKLSFGTIDINLSDENDCGADKFLEIEVNKFNKNSLLNGRFIYENGKTKLVRADEIDSYVGKTVKLRSPITCKCKSGICKTCYGVLYPINKNLSIGLLSATTIAEIITQKLLSTKHLLVAHIEKDNEHIMDYINISHERDSIICKKPFKLSITKYGKIFFIDKKNGLNEEFKHNFKYLSLNGVQIHSIEECEVDFVEGDIVFTRIRDYINSDMNILLKSINRIFEKSQVMSTINDYNEYYPHMLDLVLNMGHVQSIHSEIIMSQMVKVKGEHYKLWREHQDCEQEILAFTKSNLSNNLFNNILFERVDESLMDLNNYLSDSKKITKYEKLFSVNE